MENGSKPHLEATVGTSTKEDAREAGREVAKLALDQMRSKPDFFLLFSTIHYKNHGGFQELLNGVWEVLPEGTPLIGGTVAGFLSPQGCHARGVTGMAVSYPNMDVTIGYGKNPKRSPKKAARQCAGMIKTGLKNKYNNKFLLSMISGPEMPGSQMSPIINSKIVARIMLSLLSFSQRIFQIGFGREEDVLEELTKELPDFNLLHGSTEDSVTWKTNYQFFNKHVFTETALALGIETDMMFNLNSAHGAKKTDTEFKITHMNKGKSIIKKINNKPAFPELLRLMNWPEEKVDENRWVNTTSKRPLGFYKNDKIFLRPVMMVMGNFIGCMGKIKNENMFVTQVSPSQMIECVDELLTYDKPELGIFVSCVARQSFLGMKVYEVQDKLKRYFKEKPFLLIYTAAEAIYIPGKELEYFNETITSVIFENK